VNSNIIASRGIVDFLREALVLMPAGWKVRCVRADSGFFAEELLAFLEEHSHAYVIVAVEEHLLILTALCSRKAVPP
jgi:hypothetical protein